MAQWNRSSVNTEMRHPAAVVRPIPEGEGGLRARLLQGDLNALRTLAQQHHRSLVRLARCYVRDSSAAEAAARSVFEHAARLDGLTSETSLRPWLLGVLIRQTRGFVRSNWAPAPFSPDATCAESWNDEPTRSKLQRPEAAAVAALALEALETTLREVVLLRDVEGLAIEEVSRLLGVGERTVMARLREGRERIRAALAEFVTGAQPSAAEHSVPVL